VLLSGCAQVKPQEDFARTRELIQQSTGVDAAYDPDEVQLTTEELDAMLADGLSLDEAVRIALVNNRRLQAEFLDIGVAKAEWVQSGLLSNPSLGLSTRFPEGGGRSNFEASLAQNLVDLWQIPVRRRISQQALDQAVLRIARLAGELAADTKTAYFKALASERLLQVARESLQLVQKSHKAIRAQREAGTASALDDNLARGQVLTADVAVRNARLATADAKRGLAQRLSLDGPTENLRLTDGLVNAFTQVPSCDDLLALARTSRLDLRALQSQVQSNEAKIRLEYLKIFPEVSVGVDFERLERRALPGRNIAADTARASIASGELTAPDIQSRAQRRSERRQEIDAILGPALTMTLPIFDQNQAQIAKARYQYLQAVKAQEELEIGVAQDIRTSLDHVQTASTNLEYYRDELLPQAERNLEFAQDAYRVGQTSVLALLEAQRALLQARRDHVNVWTEAASAMAQLEKAVGVPLGPESVAEAEPYGPPIPDMAAQAGDSQ